VNISKRSLFLLLLDQAAILLAYSFARYIYSGVFTWMPDHMIQSVAAIAFPLCFYVADLYYPYKFFSRSRTFVEIVFGVTSGAFILAAIAYFDRSYTTSRLMFSYMAAGMIPCIYSIRLIYDLIFKFRMLDKKCVIVGTGPLAVKLSEIIRETPNSGLDLVGLISEEDRKNGAKNGGQIIGSLGNMLSVLDWYKVQLVVLAFEPKQDVSEVAIMSQILQRQVSVTSGIHLLENLTGEIPYQLLGGHYLLGLMSQVRMNPYVRIKRVVDLLAGVVLCLALLPIFFAAVLILLVSGHGIFFVQKRIGLSGKPFSLIKLRSMGTTKTGKPKVTRIGKWLRKYRIDEIPQLWNVLKGEMSLIGPRPEIPYFVDRSRHKIPFYDAVFSVKPGLTGWAQINFRHATTVKDYNQKFRYNLYYLKNISPTLDFVILLRTIRVVVLGKGK